MLQGTVEDGGISDIFLSGISVHESLPENFSTIKQSLSEKHSNFFSTAFKEIFVYVKDGVDEEEAGELLPPGFEENFKRMGLEYECKQQPPRSIEIIPKITEYVAVALCRQKLHDKVLEEWKSLFLDTALNQVYISSCTVKKHFTSDSNEVRIWSNKILLVGTWVLNNILIPPL